MEYKPGMFSQLFLVFVFGLALGYGLKGSTTQPDEKVCRAQKEDNIIAYYGECEFKKLEYKP